MIKISIYNNKGGVGKTTTCINLADKFSKAYPVIVVDCDEQKNSLSFFTADFPPNTANDYKAEIYPTRYNNIYITQKIEPQLADIKKTFAIKMPNFGLKYPNLTNSEIIEREFERTIVLCDLPPNDKGEVDHILGKSDYVLTPTELNHFSISGIQNVEQQIISACDAFHDDRDETVFLGFFVNKHDPHNPILLNILQQLKEISGDMVFDTIINHSYAIMNSINFGLTAAEYFNNTNTLKYGDLAEEILAKIAAHELKNQNIHNHTQKANMQDKNAESPPRILPKRYDILPEQYPHHALKDNALRINTRNSTEEEIAELADIESDIALTPEEMNLLAKLLETFGNDLNSLNINLFDVTNMKEEDIPQIQKLWDIFHTDLHSFGLPLTEFMKFSDEQLKRLYYIWERVDFDMGKLEGIPVNELIEAPDDIFDTTLRFCNKMKKLSPEQLANLCDFLENYENFDSDELLEIIEETIDCVSDIEENEEEDFG